MALQKQQQKATQSRFLEPVLLSVLITKSTKRKWELQNRKGLPMTEESKAEWEQAFIDIEESIDGLDYPNCKPDNLKYLRMKQQEIF